MANAATMADMVELRKAQRAQLVSARLTDFKMKQLQISRFNKHHVGYPIQQLIVP